MKTFGEKGTILLLSILIITSVLLTAITFGQIVISGILQSRLVDQSIAAYYLAESGAERALYQTRVRESVISCEALDKGSCDEVTATCSGDNTTPCITQTRGSLGGLVRGDWEVNVENEQDTKFTLKNGESFQIDLFSPNQVKNAGINEVHIDSSAEGLTIIGELINMSNILNASGVNACLAQDAVFKDMIEIPKTFYGLDGKDILPVCSYTLRMTYPLEVGAPDSIDLDVFVYDETFKQLPIPSRLVINSSARFGQSFQTLTVHTPIRPPLSGLYDFVLFSEQEIVK